MDVEIDNSDQAGFTLIELVIVLTVISILSVSVGLALNLGRSRDVPPDDSTRFLALVTDLRAAAIHGQTLRGINISASGLRVVPYQNATADWGQAGPEIRWRGSALLQKPRGGFAGSSQGPDIIFMPDGRLSEFQIRFIQDQRFASCKTDGFQAVKCASE